jgi:hypothetical protein
MFTAKARVTMTMFWGINNKLEVTVKLKKKSVQKIKQKLTGLHLTFE